MDWRQHIVSSPETRFGKARISGTRISVEDILGYLGSGMSYDDILTEWDYLTRDQIVACVAYAAEMMRETQPADAA